MKRILTSAGLVALGVSASQAAPDLNAIESSKPWSVSAAVRGFYDDNYTTSPSSTRDDSFGYEFTPSASINLSLDQTLLGASYEYSIKYYEGRNKNKYDQTHRFDARMDHQFSERYKLKLDNSFLIGYEPEVGVTASPLRTEGDYIRNEGSLRFTAQATELLAVELGYVNTFYDYEQDDGDTGGLDSRSGLLDRIEHLASVDLRWQIVPETVGILGYAFQVVDFTGDELISLNGLLDAESDDRNTRAHRVYVGADHRFNSQLSGSVRVGGQYTDYEEGGNSLSPYVDASLAYQYSRGNYVQAGVRHMRNETDASAVDQEITAVYASINHKITPKLLGSLLVQGQRGEFEDGLVDGEKEFYFISGLNLTYQINPFLSAEAGYNFDRLNSDISGRSYTRNRVYVGIRATY